MGIHEEEYRFCPLCGKQLESYSQNNIESIGFPCSDCGFVLYSDPKLVACTILEIDQKILLIKRANQPQKGKWVLPGGYVNRGEELEAAAIRETDEECGIKVKVNDLIGIYSYDGNPVVLTVYTVEHMSGDLKINDESLEMGLFSTGEIPWEEIGFKSTKDALKDYIKRKKA